MDRAEDEDTQFCPKMINEKKRFILFDIPEDETVDSDSSFADSYFETPTIAEESKSSSNNGPFSTRSTTFLQKLSSKFHRSPGKEGGADVMALRGIYGADFEGYAMVSRRANKKRSNLGSFLFGKNRNAPKNQFLLIKGEFCFVFKDELSPAPKYAILLASTKTRVVAHGDDGTTTVAMETNEEVLEFEFLLSAYAYAFVAAASRMALQEEETEEIQQRLGKVQHLLSQSALVRYAKRTAMETPTNEPTRPSIIDLSRDHMQQ